jgi:hypothetical protein
MLSALVGQSREGVIQEPGEGFFEYAIFLGVYDGGDDLGFWAKEVKWLHDHWSKH